MLCLTNSRVCVVLMTLNLADSVQVFSKYSTVNHFLAHEMKRISQRLCEFSILIDLPCLLLVNHIHRLEHSEETTRAS
jgi:hypothetical protein